MSQFAKAVPAGMNGGRVCHDYFLPGNFKIDSWNAISIFKIFPFGHRPGCHYPVQGPLRVRFFYSQVRSMCFVDFEQKQQVGGRESRQEQSNAAVIVVMSSQCEIDTSA